MTQATVTGIAGQHLWPSSPFWNDVSTLVLPTLALAVTLMFVSAAVSLPERSARLQRLFVGVAVLGLLTAVALALALALVPIDVRMRVLISYIFLPQLLALATLVWAWRRGDRFAP